jgi:hypothetical protein
MTTESFDRVYTRKQAATLLGVSVGTVLNLERRGLLTPVHVSDRLIGYRDSNLRRYLYEQTRPRPARAT